MVLPPFSPGEARRSEAALLEELLDVHRRQLELYREVLTLSRRQGDMVRRGAGMGEVRRVLERKKELLGIVTALERRVRPARSAWERGRLGMSAAGRRRLHGSLQEVGAIIEEIIGCEERNDADLIEQAGVAT